jgi:hypothetical protein
MQDHGHDRGDGPSSDPAAIGDVATTPAKDASTRDRRPGPFLWALAVAAALVAGLASWSVGEKTMDYYLPSEAASKNLRDPGPLRRELAVIVPRNVAIAYGTFGGILGLLMGLVGSLSLRSATRAAGASLVGLLIGVAAGVGLSFALVPTFQARLDPTGSDISLMILIRGGIAASIGAAAGLAFGLGLGSANRLIRSMIGGLLGAMTGAVAYEIINALANSLNRNDDLIPPTSTSRLLLYLSIALMGAVGSAIATVLPGRRKARERHPLAD